MNQDNVDIKAQEGEYVVPADVVRYLGLEKIQQMVNKAQDQIKEMSTTKTIGGEVTEDPMAPPKFAEGGLVTNMTTRQYISADGRILMVPFLNGQPLYAIPPGFTPHEPTASEKSGEEQAGEASGDQIRSNIDRDQRELPDSELKDKPVEEWGPEDFVKYGTASTGIAGKITKGIAGMLPFGGQLFDFAQNKTLNQAAEQLDSMLETGLDQKGEQISNEMLDTLTDTRESIKEKIAESAGSYSSPFSTLTEFLGDVMGVNSDTNKTPSGRIKPDYSSTSAKTDYNPIYDPNSQMNKSKGVNDKDGDGRITSADRAKNDPLHISNVTQNILTEAGIAEEDQ